MSDLSDFGFVDIESIQAKDNEDYMKRKTYLTDLNSNKLRGVSPKVEKANRNISYFLKRRKPTEWIVDLFGARGACVILAGDKGSGKTSFLYRLCEAVSKGEKFLYELNTIKTNVLFWQGDESQSNAINKIHRMGIETGFDLVFKDGEFAKLDIDHLRSEIKRNNYGLICMDSITTLVGNQGVRFNEPEFAEKLYQLNELAGKEKVLIILSSHLNKEDRETVNLNDLIGSGLITAAVSDIWAIYKANQQEHEDHFICKCLGKRNCDENILWNLQGSIEDYSWLLKSVGHNDLLPSKKQEYKYKLLKILPEEENALTISQIADSLGCNTKYAYRVATQLYDENELSRKKRSSGNGRPYYLYYQASFST